jgi:hypothetical protein
MVIFYIFKINNIKIKTCFFFRYSGIEITITASPNKEAAHGVRLKNVPVSGKEESQIFSPVLSRVACLARQ